jgi:hypothetical protein
MSHWLRTSGCVLVLAAVVGCRHEPTPGVTVVIGSVRDGATDEALSGARVVVNVGTGTEIAALTDAQGRFQLQFDAPPGAGSHALEAVATLAGYDAGSQDIIVIKGKPAENSYDLRLLPEGVTACIQNERPVVIVGHFRPAPGQPDPDLSDRIADTLRINLLTQIQKANFSSRSQPRIFPCAAAEPKVPERYGGYAKLFRADAYVGGYVTRPDPVKVKLQITVADGYGVMPAPLNATSPDVDLEDPQLARLAPEASAAVLTALAIGYKRAGEPDQCIDLIAASERLLGDLPETLLTLRDECKALLPNRGLL